MKNGFKIKTELRGGERNEDGKKLSSSCQVFVACVDVMFMLFGNLIFNLDDSHFVMCFVIYEAEHR